MPNEMTTEEMLNDLDKHYSDQMTEWQGMFVANMIEGVRLADESGITVRFTEKQAMKVAEIYAEKDEEM